MPTVYHQTAHIATTSPVILVTLPSVNKLAVVDPSTFSIKSLVDVPGGPEDLIANPSHAEVYVSVNAGSAISIVDYRTPQLRGSIAVPDGVYRFVMNASGDRLYAVNATGTVSVISVVRRQVLNAISLGTSTRGIAYSSLSHRIFASMPESNEIAVINSDTNRRERDVFMGQCGMGRCRAYDLVASLDGRYILAACNNGMISAIDAQSDSIISKFSDLTRGNGPFLGVDPVTNYVAMTVQELNQYFILVPTVPPFTGVKDVNRLHNATLVDVAFNPDTGTPYGAQSGRGVPGKIVIEPKDPGDKVLLLGASPGGMTFAQ